MNLGERCKCMALLRLHNGEPKFIVVGNHITCFQLCVSYMDLIAIVHQEKSTTAIFFPIALPIESLFRPQHAFLNTTKKYLTSLKNIG